MPMLRDMAGERARGVGEPGATEQKESNTVRLRRAEIDQLAHTHFIHSLDRVNSVVVGTHDLEQMMSEVLEAVLSIFDCDRAWLVFPCDPEAETWHSPMEKTRPDYPGALQLGGLQPVDEDIAATFRILLAADGPVTFGPDSPYPIPEDVGQRFTIRSFIGMVLYPKIGLPWLFGLHQCSHARVWSRQEQKLFEQIGRRLCDGLTSLLTWRDLQRSERDFRSLAENSPDMISRVDADCRYLYVNSEVTRVTGIAAADFIGQVVGDTRVAAGHDVNLSTLQQMRAAIRRAFDTGQSQRCDVLTRRNGEQIYEYRIAPERDAAGHMTSALCIGRDVTERRRAEQAQKRLIRSLRLLSMSNQLVIHAQEESALLADVCRLIVEVGGYRLGWITLTGASRSTALRPVARFSDEDGRLDPLDSSVPESLWSGGPTAAALAAGEAQLVQDIAADPRFDAWRERFLARGFGSCACLLLKDARGVLGTLSIFAGPRGAFPPQELELLQELAGDITYGMRTLRTRAEHWAAETKLAFLALHDPLTKLPNRVALRERFQLALAAAERKGGRIAMLFLDLDHFKEINDSLGHEVGDRLLLQVAERLQSRVPHSGIVAREGGDVFLILLTEPSELPAVEQFARELLERIDQPVQVGDNLLQSTASIGISVYPDDGEDFETLRRNSDAALFHAKDQGRNTCRFFNERMNLDAVERVEMQSKLRAALRAQEFRLHYQPQVRVRDGAIIGAEALIRWRTEDGEMIPPGRFIPVAEKSGLIIPIGQWVLEEACRQAMAWQAAGLPDFVVAVNLSVVQFARGDVVEAVRTALQTSGLAPQRLELEITESVLLHDTDAALETLRALKKLGVTLSIDDFGTGYSSLAYLKRLPVDKLKIAHPFVKQLASSREDAAIVRAIIQLGHTLQLEVIAEGVEVEGQLRFLRTNGCNLIQGFLVSPPVSAQDFPQLLARRTALAGPGG
jgi:diguanylate cyclase (GGDEF)-like protein/PAS domain S-box-containing protein